MKNLIISASSLFVYLLFVAAGCGWMPSGVNLPGEPGQSLSKVQVYTKYAPARIKLLPLTRLVVTKSREESAVDLYVSLVDSFACEQKWPGKFRFELYEKIKRVAESKGKRIAIWPDMDLMKPTENDRYWQNFLRAYHFNLDFDPEPGKSYILQVTFTGPSNRRLCAEYTLGPAN
ncbi:MAG: hypothetical protein JXB29_12535 [Sedimentisphaerales bacterium]|nr:hypothetical protein [Sedimentisphaerales bacterium]